MKNQKSKIRSNQNSYNLGFTKKANKVMKKQILPIEEPKKKVKKKRNNS